MTVKKWKRAAAGLLAGILLLGAAGCGNTEAPASSEGKASKGSNSETPDAQDVELVKGRFLELLKETPEGVSSIENMVRLSDGRIAFLDPAEGDLYYSGDNAETWEAKPLPAFSDKLGMEEIEITSKAIAPDGGVFYSYVNWKEDVLEEGSVIEHYIYIDKDGNDSEITLTDPTSSYNFYLSDAWFTGEKTLIGEMNGGSVYQIDLESGVITSVSGFGEEFESLFWAGDYLLSKEYMYQVSSASFVEDDVLKEFIAKETSGYRLMAFYFDSEENTLYSASSGGLYSHTIGGGAMENLLDGGLCNLGDPTKSPVSILKNEDGSFLIAYDDGEIDQYTYDKEAPAVPTQQLNVYSLNQNMTVSKAVSLFRKQHPDVYVKQEIGLAGDYGVTEEDAIRNLNTRLLAGEGPDIILLDDMPIDSYIEKDMLADLAGLADELEQENSYFTSVLRAYQQEDGLYAMPIRFQVPVIIGKKDTAEGLSGIEGFAGAVQKVREAHPNADTVLGTYTAEDLMKRLYMLFSSDFMKDGKADTDAIRQFLEKAEEIYQNEQQNITDAMRQSYEDSMTWRKNEDMMEPVENFSVMTNIYELISGSQNLMISKMRGMDDMQMLNGILDNDGQAAYDVMHSQAGDVFVPYGIAGVSKGSKEQELAMDFMRALLGEDVQKSDLTDGFPVNADAYDKFTETSNPDATVGFSVAESAEDGSSTEPIHFSASWPSADKIAAFKDKFNMLKVPSLLDHVIYTAVLEGGCRVLTGEVSLDGGCDEIVQKVELYLAE